MTMDTSNPIRSWWSRRLVWIQILESTTVINLSPVISNVYNCIELYCKQRIYIYIHTHTHLLWVHIFHLTKKEPWNHHPLKGWVFEGGILNVRFPFWRCLLHNSLCRERTTEPSHVRQGILARCAEAIPQHPVPQSSSCCWRPELMHLLPSGGPGETKLPLVGGLCHCFVGLQMWGMSQDWPNKIFWRWLIF